MRMRLGATLLVAAASFAWFASPAQAAHCGAGSYGCGTQPTCDAQCNFGAHCNQCRPSYKVVYDNCTEKRFHTCYQNVTETVMKQVQKTCYRTEQRTTMKPTYCTEYTTVQKTVC